MENNPKHRDKESAKNEGRPISGLKQIVAKERIPVIIATNISLIEDSLKTKSLSSKWVSFKVSSFKTCEFIEYQ